MNSAPSVTEELPSEATPCSFRQRRTVHFVMLPLAIGAFAASIYMAWAAFNAGKLAGCDNGSFWSCAHVFDSDWSSWYGVPVSLPGALVYGGVVLCLAAIVIQRKPVAPQWAANGLTLGIIAAVLSGIWFTGLQIVAIEKLCPWCLSVHSLGLTLAILLLAGGLAEWREVLRWGGLAATAVAVLITGQFLDPPVQRYETHRFDPSDESTETRLADDDVAPGMLFDAPSTELMDAPSDAAIFDAPTLHATPVASVLTAAEHPPALIVAPDEQSNPAQTLAGIDRAPSTAPFRDEDQEPQQPVHIVEPGFRGAQPAPPSARPEQLNLVDPPLEAPGMARLPVPTQSPVPDEPTNENAPAPEASSGRYIVFGGKTLNLKLNVMNRPILGSPDAPVVFIELFDYTCPHCREMNRYVSEARRLHGDQLAILILPTPLSHYCNPYANGTTFEHQDACELARLAVAVWKINPDAFPGFHDWLSAPSNGRSAGEARLYAETLVDPARLQQLMGSQYISEFLKQHTEIYRIVGTGILPKLYSDKVGIIGKTNGTADLLNQIMTGHSFATTDTTARRQ